MTLRRPAALLLSLPVMLAGGIAAHWLAYVMAVPDAGARRTLLAATGHAYQSRLPAIAGGLGGVTVMILIALALGQGGLVSRLRLRPRWFVVVPIAGFALQEFAERVAVGYDAPWHVWFEPTFWRGLVLQVPFGLLAYLIAAVLLRGARIVHHAVGRRRQRRHAIPRTAADRPVPTAYYPLLVRRVRCGDALRFRGPPPPARGAL